jgi:fatty-acyl-CoA synthase
MNFIRNLLVRNARSFAERPAFITEGASVTHRELNERVNRVANAIGGMGLQKGAVIALYARNSIEFVDVFFASHKLGATVSAINIRFKERELEYQLSHCGARALVFEAAFAAAVDAVRGRTQIEHFVCIGSPVPDWAKPYDAFLAGASAEEPYQVDIAPDDIATILYTSGTTGLPKAVPMRYWSGLYLGCLETNNDIGLTAADVTLCVAPLFHQAAHGFTLVMPLSVGGTVVSHPRFDPLLVLRDIEAHRVSFSFMVPTMAEAVLRTPVRTSRDTSSFRKLLSSGSALTEPTKLALLKAFPGLQIFENYGATESFNTSRLLPGDVLRKQNCAGLPLPTQQVRVVTSKGDEVGVREVGEIVVKGVAMFGGYLNPPANADCAIDDAGWFHTGDLAYMDEEGYLYIVGRSKDVIISGGENIYPREIEEVISQIAGVRECAVIGLKDEYWGETVCACVVVERGGPDANTVIDVCSKSLADYKKPRRVVFLEELPRNAAGKVLRKPLVETVEARVLQK